MLIPLHVKSHYSPGHGTASLEALLDRAAAQGLPALALTDRETLAGQLYFHELCRNRGIRPITGLELECAAGKEGRAGRLLLLARDREGYRSLCRIVSRRRAGAGSEPEQQAAADAVAAVAAHPAGLFILTDHAHSLERLITLPQIERSALRALIVRPDRSARHDPLLQVASNNRILAVADPEVVLLDRSDQPLYLLLAAIHRHVRVETLQPGAEPALERWMRTPTAAEGLFSDLPQAVEEANRVASRCLLELEPSAAPLVPRAAAFGGRAPDEELARRCGTALDLARKRGLCRDARYHERLAHELEVVSGLGYAGYFLAAAEIADEAGRRDIPVALRGSAAGSLAVHLLGISAIDPLERGLYFERFLHFGRRRPPDIDLDVCSRRRDELIRWACRRFGRQRVALVGVYQRFQLASAFRYGLKALGATRSEIEAFMGQLSGRGLEGLAASGELATADTPEAEEDTEAEAGDLPLTLLSPTQRSAAPTLLRLVGLPRQLTLHPGGLLIADQAIDDHVPVERASRNLTVAQYDLRSIEQAAFPKLDLLGNRFLSQMAETLDLVNARGGIAGTRSSPAVQAGPLPLDDAETLARISRADTLGCFQIETPPVRALLDRLPVRTIEDLVAVLALVRPGAGAGSARRDYVRRVHGTVPSQRTHPLLAERLSETHGMLLYDEDLMAVLSGVASISLAAADEIRSAIVDADRTELARLEQSFLELTEHRGGDASLARSAWRSIAAFASYTFCKAHAWSYALLAYQAAYLKTHYPLELGCALLNNYGGAYPLRTIVADLMRAGLHILPPCVQRSALETSVERHADGSGALRVGLDKLKYLTKKNAQTILAERARAPFQDLRDFLTRVPLGRRELRALVLSGACDGLAPLSAHDYPFAHEQLLDPTPGGGAVPSAATSQAREDLDRYRALVRMRNELELMSMHLADHPLRVLREEARRYGCLSSADLRAMAQPPQGVLRFAGIVAASRRHRRGAGGPPEYFLTFEDEHGLLEAVIPPDSYYAAARELTTPGPYLIEGKLTRDRGHVLLTVTAIWPFHERARVGTQDRRHAHA